MMNTNDTPRVAIYARFSVGEKNAVKIGVQVNACRKYAAQQGWTVPDEDDDGSVFKDEGISGAVIAALPDHRRLMALIGDRNPTKRSFDVVLVHHSDRFSRSDELTGIVKRLRFWKVRLIGVLDHFDSTAPTANTQAAVNGIVSSQTIEAIRLKVREAHAGLVKRRKNPGGRPYGYKVVWDSDATQLDPKSGLPVITGKRLVPDEAEAAVVRDIFRMYADENMSAEAIAKYLNEHNVPSPGSRWKRTIRRTAKWMGSTVSSNPKRGLGILHNPIYKGLKVWYRAIGDKNPDTGGKIYDLQPNTEWVTEYTPHLRIIGDDLWDPAQARMRLRAQPRGEAISRGIAKSKEARVGGRDSRYLLGSILKCGVCHANLIGYSRTEYCCPSFSAGACTNDIRVNRDQLHQELFDALKAHWMSPEALAEGRRFVEAELKAWEREQRNAATAASQSKEMKKLAEKEKQALALDDDDMREAALAIVASKRAAISAAATAGITPRIVKAKEILAALPEIVAEYTRMVENAAKALTDARQVAAAREQVRKLLKGGKIVLGPDDDHRAWVGRIEFVDLGTHTLELAGIRRVPKPSKSQPADFAVLDVLPALGVPFYSDDIGDTFWHLRGVRRCRGGSVTRWTNDYGL